MKKHMRIKDKAYLNFFETINYEVKEMMKEKDLYEDYDDSFAVDKKKDLLSFDIKEKLFHIVFNEKLLAFLWKKIQKIILMQCDISLIYDVIPNFNNVNIIRKVPYIIPSFLLLFTQYSLTF